MNKLLFRSLLFFCIIMQIAATAHSQTTQRTIKDYAESPYWIAMMDDPDVNYFEAVKAYDTYWKYHKKPKEEDEIIGRKIESDEKKRHSDSWIRRLFSGDKEKESQLYAFECKKFEHWKMKSEPYVQQDGRILSPGERLNLWEQRHQQH
jgi:hypothetical protein